MSLLNLKDMILVNLLLCILCALVIFLFVMQIGILANLYIFKNTPDSLSENTLLTEPDGVEEFIPTTDGGLIRSLHKASGPAVVLIPDWGLSMVTMNLLWRQLAAKGYQVITFDHRGHGDSQAGSEGYSPEILARDLRDILDFYRLNDCILVGHSAGAFLAMKYLLDYPEESRNRVNGLVSLAGFGALSPEEKNHNRFPFSVFGSGVLRRLLKTELYGWSFSAVAFGDRPAPSMLRAFMKVVLKDQHKIIKSVWDQIGKQNLYSRLSALSLPVTLVSSLSDRRIDPNASQLLAQHIPAATANCLEEPVGNMLVWEAPGKLAEIIRKFERMTQGETV
ncbi:MAG: alpha/beta hydrolase [Bacteroidia bacterium]|nr:alpha/beta hydrolase [Bacteroidia bacterium]